MLFIICSSSNHHFLTVAVFTPQYPKTGARISPQSYACGYTQLSPRAQCLHGERCWMKAALGVRGLRHSRRPGLCRSMTASKSFPSWACFLSVNTGTIPTRVNSLTELEPWRSKGSWKVYTNSKVSGFVKKKERERKEASPCLSVMHVGDFRAHGHGNKLNYEGGSSAICSHGLFEILLEEN